MGEGYPAGLDYYQSEYHSDFATKVRDNIIEGIKGAPGLRQTQQGHTQGRSMHLKKDQDLIESTQKFACKMTTKNWDKGYDELFYDNFTFPCRQKVVS